MELALQFGWGMMGHTRAILKEWGEATVILSPRDLSDKQLRRFSGEILGRNARILLDPQFYLPHSDHHRLVAHAYWPDDYDSVLFWSGRQLSELLSRLDKLNEELETSAVILPGRLASVVDDDWLAQQTVILEEAERLGIDPTTSYATVALSEDAIADTARVEALLEGSKEWPQEGIYLICEHPSGDYLVEDPNWLANQLDLIAGWRLRGKRVVLGYANHQNLVAAAAGANAMASGTWMNVRSFPPDKFRSQYEEEIRRRTTWYYAPAALSEFKIPFLDIAARQGLLAEMAPPNGMSNRYSVDLFQSVQPSTADFSERNAFRHYLHCLNLQVSEAQRATFGETCQWLRGLWDEAEEALEKLHSVGVRGQMRDFNDCLDACRAALRVLEDTRGPLLRREWERL